MAELRRCIGSTRFGIEAHDASPEDFPVQPSQKEGLGRMCKPHWRQYVNALGKARRAAKTAAGAPPTVQSQAAARVATKRAARVATAGKKPEPIRTRVPKWRRKAEAAMRVPIVHTGNHDALEEAKPEPAAQAVELSPSLRASLNFAAGISGSSRIPRTPKRAGDAG